MNKKNLEELKKLNLPVGKYAIFGSGPVAIRNIRESNDLDIIVKKDLWTKLLNRYKKYYNPARKRIELNNIEIYLDWLNITTDLNEIIDSAYIIDGFPYAQLKYVIEWKKSSQREKDIEDLKLIDKYLKYQPS
jgi:hypothetical protein